MGSQRNNLQTWESKATQGIREKGIRMERSECRKKCLVARRPQPTKKELNHRYS